MRALRRLLCPCPRRRGVAHDRCLHSPGMSVPSSSPCTAQKFVRIAGIDGRSASPRQRRRACQPHERSNRDCRSFGEVMSKTAAYYHQPVTTRGNSHQKTWSGIWQHHCALHALEQRSTTLSHASRYLTHGQLVEQPRTAFLRLELARTVDHIRGPSRSDSYSPSESPSASFRGTKNCSARYLGDF